MKENEKVIFVELLRMLKAYTFRTQLDPNDAWLEEKALAVISKAVGLLSKNGQV